MAVEVSDWNELDAVRNDLTGDYVLVNDIDENSSGYDTHASSTANGGEGWLPLGGNDGATGGSVFTGSFDGQGFTIDSMYIDRPSTGQGGLFRGLDTDTYLRDVGITNVDITGFNVPAALAGIIPDGGANGLVISGIYATGSIAGTRSEGPPYVAGFIGLITRPADMTIQDCYSTCSCESTNNKEYVGGLFGWLRNDSGSLTVRRCYATGEIITTATDQVGGFAGRADSTSGISDNFWDTETSGRTVAATDEFGDPIAVATGKTTTEMKDRDTFTDTATTGLDTAWDMADVDTYDETKVWGIGELGGSLVNDGYPFLMVFQEETETVDEVTLQTDYINIGQVAVEETVVLDTDYAVVTENTTALSADYAVSTKEQSVLDTDYTVGAAQQNTLSTDYAVRASQQETLDTDYAVTSDRTQTLDADYAVADTDQTTLDTDYAVTSQDQNTLSTDYAVGVKESTTLDTDYAVIAPQTVQLDTNYVVTSEGINPYCPMDTPYSDMESPYEPFEKDC